MKVTPVGVRYLLLSLAVGLAAVNTGNNLLYLLFAMMLSLILVSGVLSERALRRLTATRTLPPRLFAWTSIPCRTRCWRAMRSPAACRSRAVSPWPTNC